MGRTASRFFPPVAVIICFSAIVWSTWVAPPEPADLTVSNGTEIKSIDPAAVSGQPEGFVIRALFEGLVDWHPKDLHAIPGVAESWDLSTDLKTYTFHLRRNAQWSNGDPVTARDFVYSMRRFLDPLTASEYVFLLNQVVGAKEYNEVIVEAGDPVEVELTERVEGALPHARNRVLHGELIATEELVLGPESEETPEETTRIYHVRIDGEPRRFCPGYKDAESAGLLAEGVERCTQVLLDFRAVGIRAPDDHTLEIQLNNPTPYFLQLMGFYTLFPVHRECVETHGYPEWTKPENLVNNGPFVIESRKVRDRIRLKRNPHFWDQEHLHLDTLDILAVESQTTELNMYLDGQIEYFRQAPNAIIPELLRQKRPDFNPQPYLAVYFYKLNTKVRELRDKRVRRALSLAVNRRELVERVTRAGQVPAYRYVPPGIPDFEATKKLLNVTEVQPDHEADVARAKQLLAEAGYPDGQGMATLTLSFNSNDMHSQIAELLQAQWKDKLGVNVKLEAKEWGSFLSDIRQGDFQMAREGWIGDYADPNTFLELFVTNGPQNNTNWGDAKYDQLIQDASAVDLNEEERADVAARVRRESTKEGDALQAEIKAALDYAWRVKRMKLLLEAEQMILDETPIICLYYYVTQGITRPWVEGWHQNLQDAHPFRGVKINREMKARMIAEGLR